MRHASLEETIITKIMQVIAYADREGCIKNLEEILKRITTEPGEKIGLEMKQEKPNYMTHRPD